MKTRMNIRRGSWNWTRLGHLQSPECEGYALANGFRPDNHRSFRKQSQFCFSFGAYGWTNVRVWADPDCFEDAFEIAIEWLDDNAPGHLVSYAEFNELRKEAAEELGLDLNSDDDDIQQSITEAAEVDLTVVGHTTLKHGMHIASYDWTVDEITF